MMVSGAMRRIVSTAASKVWAVGAGASAMSASLLQVNRDLCRRALTSLLLTSALIAEENDGEEAEKGRRIYLPAYYRAEQEVALRIRQLMLSIRPDKFAGAVKAVSAFEKRRGIQFSKNQREAIVQALETGVFVITGGPGTGKTTIINCILELLSDGNEVLLLTPRQA